MKKMFRKFSIIAFSAGVLLSGFGATTADAAQRSYASPYFEYGVYLGGGNGVKFDLAGTQYFYATHSAVYSGHASGVIYQIRTTNGKTVVKRNQQSGAITNKKVSVNGPIGKHKAYLRNMYNTSTPQRASGIFYY